jgi:hypothetical protein
VRGVCCDCSKIPPNMQFTEQLLAGERVVARSTIGSREEEFACKECGAERWKGEMGWSSLCCLNGKCVLPLHVLPEPGVVVAGASVEEQQR